MTQHFSPTDWSTVQARFDDLAQAELNADTLQAWLKQWSDLESELAQSSFQAYRAVSENTADKDAEAHYMHIIEHITPKQREANQVLNQKLLGANINPMPQEIAGMLKRLEAESSIYCDENLPLLTEVERLDNEFSKIIGAMMIEFDGESLTIQQAGAMLEDPDRELRERVYKLLAECQLAARETLNEIFLKMLNLRQQIAKNAGLANYRDYIWKSYARFDYTPEDCVTFHNAIEHEVVPIARKWAEYRRKQLGLEKLRPWDMVVDPLGRDPLKPFSNAAELESGVQSIFNHVDPVLGEYFTRMRDGYLDLDSRPGKAPGGYCGGLMVDKVPYIFMNAVGTHDDVQTMLHEGGHAFHFLESVQNNSLLWNYDGPMEFCEVASMAMELLAAPYLEESKGGFYSQTDADRARTEHLLGNINFLPYMAVVDAFQHWLYTQPVETITSDVLDAKWEELIDRFMPVQDWSGSEDVKVTGWHRKPHIFFAPFYYIEYGLAQLGATQVWRNALDNQAEAVRKYRGALAQGYKLGLADLFKEAGAEFAFDRKLVGSLAQLADEHISAMLPSA